MRRHGSLTSVGGGRSSIVWLLAALLATLPARGAVADDPARTTLHAHLDDTADTAPLLELDPALRFDPVEGLGTDVVERHRASLALGPRARLSAEATVWSNAALAEGDWDPQTQHGWTAGARYDVELAWGVRLEVDASLMKLARQGNGMFGDGMVAGYGAALTRYFHWSGGRVAWISLGVEHTEFLGDAVVGVPRGTTVGLRVGTTF